MLLPKPLQPKSKVALIAPSSSQPAERLEAAMESVFAFGLEPVLYNSCTQEYGFLAACDDVRASDINKAFADPAIDGVICIRGGYGAHRLMPLIDFDMIKNNPKRLLGYSDITALHIQLNQRCGMVSWHTPMPGTEWYKGLDEYTAAGVRQALFGEVEMQLANPTGAEMETLVPGKAEGRLVGGNLSLVVATLGTPYEIDTKDKILLLEDVDEEPYTLDRMFVQLNHSGKLQQAAGLLIGPFTNCEGKKEKKCLPIQTVLQELVASVGKPAITNLQCGHVLPTMSLPLGAMASMDATGRHFEITGV